MMFVLVDKMVERFHELEGELVNMVYDALFGRWRLGMMNYWYESPWKILDRPFVVIETRCIEQRGLKIVIKGNDGNNREYTLFNLPDDELRKIATSDPRCFSEFITKLQDVVDRKKRYSLRIRI